jgi:hypothetical protein
MDPEAASGRVTPPPLLAKSSTVPPAGCRTFRRIARLSWLLPLAGIIMIVIGEVILVIQGRPSGVCAAVAILLFGAGIVAGVVGLCGIAQYGKRGILWHALAGILVSFPLLLFGLIHGLYTVVHTATLPSPAHLSPAAHSPSAQRLRDDKLQFSIDVPQGFEDFAEAKADPVVKYAFVRRSPDRKTACVITIEPMNTMLSRTHRYRISQIQPGIQGKITLRKWRGVDIDVQVATVLEAGVANYTYSCMVPLRPMAIRLAVGETGPESDPEALSRLVDTLLSSLDGETNW